MDRPDLLVLRCGCIYYDFGPSLRCPAHPGDDTCPHEEDKTLTVWPGETWERMTWTCRLCGNVRGRVFG